MKLFDWQKPPRVYVDAKILNVHDASLTREAYVGFIVEGTGKYDAGSVDATESDDAEVLAVIFAIEKLKESLKRFTIVCDHESVVSEANKEEESKNASQHLLTLRKLLKENKDRIRLEVLQANPAHGVVTEYVNRTKASVSESE